MHMTVLSFILLRFKMNRLTFHLCMLHINILGKPICVQNQPAHVYYFTTFIEWQIHSKVLQGIIIQYCHHHTHTDITKQTFVVLLEAWEFLLDFVLQMDYTCNVMQWMQMPIEPKLAIGVLADQLAVPVCGCVGRWPQNPR